MSGRMTYAAGALALVAMGDMEVNAGAILPYQDVCGSGELVAEIQFHLSD